MNNFNLVAPVYELLKLVVFGQSLTKAENHFCHLIKPTDRVLIIGGGHGKIMNALPADCQIDYLEFSSTMIQMAKQNSKGKSVNFIHGDFLKTKLSERYDWIITSFFLDVFNEQNLRSACHKMHQLLTDDGQLLVTDFSTTKGTTGKLLLWTMHAFFKIAARLESNSLQPIGEYLQSAGLALVTLKSFASGKVFSAIFKKSGNLR
ncbi:MAG: methyltransferase domain-containing protein [Bacteroidota bacterium]